MTPRCVNLSLGFDNFLLFGLLLGGLLLALKVLPLALHILGLVLPSLPVLHHGLVEVPVLLLHHHHAQPGIQSLKSTVILKMLILFRNNWNQSYGYRYLSVLRIRIRIRIHLIHMFLIRIHLSELWIRIILSFNKNSKKNLDFYCFVTSF